MPTRSALRYLVLAACAVIVYGSLYPFDFRPLQGGELRALSDSLLRLTTRGDILSNVILFVPLGLLARLTWPRQGWLTLLLWSGALALAVQLAQLFLPSRDASLQDVLWNLLGVVLGAASAGLVRRLRAWGLPLSTADAFALGLLGLWLAARLTPFVPSLDWQLIKDSLKPLLLHPQWDGVRILVQTALWAVAARLWWTVWQGPARLPLYFAGAGAVFALEAIIVANVVTLPSVLGATLGGLLWGLVLSRRRGGDAALAVFLMLALVVQGLAPFQLRPVAEPFRWLPMHGFLQGLSLFNVGVLLAKAYFYGALLWMVRREGASLRFATALAFTLTFALELAQTRIVGHTPEITDPLIALAMAALYRALTPDRSMSTESARLR